MNSAKKEYKYLTKNNIKLEEVNCPPSIKNAVKIIAKKNCKMPPKGILNMVITKIAHMVLSKKIKVDNAGEIFIPNQFGMILLASGSGKDRTLNDINTYIMPLHKQWFNNKADLHYKKEMDMYETQQLEEQCRKAAKKQELTLKGGRKGGDDNVSTASLPF